MSVSTVSVLFQIMSVSTVSVLFQLSRVFVSTLLIRKLHLQINIIILSIQSPWHQRFWPSHPQWRKLTRRTAIKFVYIISLIHATMHDLTASFPGLHAQLLLLAVRKAGEGLDGFIMW